jgi:four helix bundle protein
MKSRNFRDLKVWQTGKRLVLDVYTLTKSFPDDERYGLIAQMRRAAVSIPSNIAEGFNRIHNKEYRQFLYVALGSCAELETQIEIAAELGFISNVDEERIVDIIDHESRMLRKLIKIVSDQHEIRDTRYERRDTLL